MNERTKPTLLRRVCDVSALGLLTGCAVRLGQMGEQAAAACVGLLAVLYLAALLTER